MCVIMDFMLEEELMDLFTLCLQNPSSPDLDSAKQRIVEIGKELFTDGGIDALENMSFALKNRITEEIDKDPTPLKSLWNGITPEWNY